jgi:MFS family permease
MAALQTGITNTLARTFRSLRGRNYRLYFGAQIVSQSGTWMQSIAQGWLVVHLTGSALLLALTVALQFGPVLVVGPVGGLVADRTDKRKLLIATQTTMTVLAAVLGVLTLTGVVRVWMILVLATLYGVTNGLDNPARQAFVTEMVGEDDVVNAVSLNSVIVNASRVVGPAIAGILIVTLGLGACFLVNAVSYLFVIAALVAMRSAELHRTRPLPREGGQLRAGFAYVWRTPELRVPLTIMVVVGTLGYNFSILLPLMAKLAFHRGGGTYSVLLVAMGVGALAGGLYAASLRRPSRRLLVVATLGFGAVTVVGAFMPTVAWEVAVLVPLGVFSVLFVTTTNSLLQLNSETAMRGRVMSLWAVVFLGATPFGSLIIGGLSAAFGPRAAFAAGGAATFLAGVGAYAALRRRRWPAGALGAPGGIGAAPALLPRVCLPDDPEPDEAIGDLDPARSHGGRRPPAAPRERLGV